MKNQIFTNAVDRYVAIMNLSGRGIEFSGKFIRLPNEISNKIADFGLVSLSCSNCNGVIRYQNEKNVAWVEKFEPDVIICNKCDNKKFNLQDAYKKFQQFLQGSSHTSQCL